MSPYFEPYYYSKEEIEELLKLASSDKFNIFYNKNEIVVNLCRALLKEMETNEDKQ